jgi:hypothetical protein
MEGLAEDFGTIPYSGRLHRRQAADCDGLSGQSVPRSAFPANPRSLAMPGQPRMAARAVGRQRMWHVHGRRSQVLLPPAGLANGESQLGGWGLELKTSGEGQAKSQS